MPTVTSSPRVVSLPPIRSSLAGARPQHAQPSTKAAIRLPFYNNVSNTLFLYKRRICLVIHPSIHHNCLRPRKLSLTCVRPAEHIQSIDEHANLQDASNPHLQERAHCANDRGNRTWRHAVDGIQRLQHSNSTTTHAHNTRLRACNNDAVFLVASRTTARRASRSPHGNNQRHGE